MFTVCDRIWYFKTYICFSIRGTIWAHIFRGSLIQNKIRIEISLNITQPWKACDWIQCHQHLGKVLTHKKCLCHCSVSGTFLPYRNFLFKCPVICLRKNKAYLKGKTKQKNRQGNVFQLFTFIFSYICPNWYELIDYVFHYSVV